MISVNNLVVAYGGFTLLNDVNFHISENDKIGLVGKNGAGKSTILKLICGLQSPTSGQVAVPNGVKIGYLPQIMEHHRGKSVIDEAMTAFADLFSLEDELENIAAELAIRQDYESKEYQDLIIRMNEVNDALTYNRSDNPRVMAEKTLIGLGFRYDELERPTETFSQGWNMRIELAKILLSKPDVLLLDEPTNHLDIDSKEILEHAINNFEGTILYVSHDRYFINTTATRIINLTQKQIVSYPGNYDYYLEKKEDAEKAQLTAASILSKENVHERSGNKLDWQQQKEEQARQRKIENELKKAETEIEKLETRNSEIDLQLSDPANGTNIQLLQELSKEQETNTNRLEELMELWESLSDKL